MEALNDVFLIRKLKMKDEKINIFDIQMKDLSLYVKMMIFIIDKNNF